MANMTEGHAQALLIQQLAEKLKQQGEQVLILETHISSVLVTSQFAYKLKKPLRFDFLDFSTLEKRHFYCQEELRLNRRLAPGIYIDVVAVTGSYQHPILGGTGIPIEYAVRMRSFSQDALWSHRLMEGTLSAAEIDDLAVKIAQFHSSAALAPVSSDWGTAKTIEEATRDTLTAILPAISAYSNNQSERDQVQQLTAWCGAQIKAHGAVLEERRAHGMIRECHGDLHSGNILTIDGRVEVFDCIEFNDSLRWIDVIEDIAFIYMDLRFHQRPGFAARLLNRYLECTGDYESLPIFPYYVVLRALVRCKIALLRAKQFNADDDEAMHAKEQARLYLALASAYAKPREAAVVLMHGYSGSGKSTLANLLVEITGALQIRSDVERKRMHGLAATARTVEAIGEGIYAQRAIELIYARLLSLARGIVQSGMPVIVDAAFLKSQQRQLFLNLASELNCAFFIVNVTASEAVMKERIVLRKQRDQDPSDAGLDVLAYQIANQEALSDKEMNHVIHINCDTGLSDEQIANTAAPILNALHKLSDKN